MKCDIVFEGGGAKGVALVGAWREFQDQGYAHNRLLGASAGAIMAVFLAAGYTAQEMYDVLTEKRNGQSVLATFLGDPEPPAETALFQSAIAAFLRDVDLPLLPDAVESAIYASLLRALAARPRFRNLYSFVEYGGWYTADAFVDWLTQKLDTGMHNGAPRHFSGMTFHGLHATTGVDLSLVISDTTAARLRILNHRTSPDCPVVWAVRMSMSIPLLWQEVIWMPEWGSYMERSLDGHVIVDGGLLSNFPLELFLSQLPYVTDMMGPATDAPVVGFLIDEARPLADVMTVSRSLGAVVNVGQLQTAQRLSRLLDTVTTARDKLVIDAHPELVVRLPAQGYGTVEFDMSDLRRDNLIEAGALATREHLRLYPPGASSRGLISPDRSVLMHMADRIAENILTP